MKSDFSHGRKGLRIQINDLGLIYIQYLILGFIIDVMTYLKTFITKFSTKFSIRIVYMYRGGPPEGVIWVTRIAVTLSIFYFSRWFLVQIVENRRGRLSRPFLSPGDNFSKRYDENQIWSERNRRAFRCTAGPLLEFLIGFFKYFLNVHWLFQISQCIQLVCRCCLHCHDTIIPYHPGQYLMTAGLWKLIPAALTKCELHICICNCCRVLMSALTNR